MKFYVSFPMKTGKAKWLNDLGINIEAETNEFFIGDDELAFPVISTRWYVDLPDDIALLYTLKWL